MVGAQQMKDALRYWTEFETCSALEVVDHTMVHHKESAFVGGSHEHDQD